MFGKHISTSLEIFPTRRLSKVNIFDIDYLIYFSLKCSLLSLKLLNRETLCFELYYNMQV